MATGWRQASATLDQLRETTPAHAGYIDSLIEWCMIEGPAHYTASVAAEAVRGVVNVDSIEWKVLTETFGDPNDADWGVAQRTYGPKAGLPGLAR